MRILKKRLAYDAWWDELYPTMMARGGDEGDPDVSSKASRKARSWKGPTSDAEIKDKNATDKKPAESSSRFNRIDANGDGEITKEEYAAPFVKQITVKDQNHDGQLSVEELDARHFKAVDSDQDGQLTADEIRGFYEQKFKQIDSDQSGSISADEM